MGNKSLVHLNNNLMCAIDLETTGRVPGYHEILQLAIIPLDNWLEPRKDLPLFDIFMRPNHLDRIDMESLEITKLELHNVITRGIDPEKARELFEHWYSKLNIPDNKRIVPLGFGIAMFDVPFLIHWLEHSLYQTYFHGFPRDALLVANYLNDVADRHVETVPFPKFKLKEIARALGIEVFDSETHAALYDAYIAAEVYKKLLSHDLLNPV